MTSRGSFFIQCVAVLEKRESGKMAAIKMKALHGRHHIYKKLHEELAHLSIKYLRGG